MIVAIEESVFEQYHSNPFEIITLLRFGFDGRHYILTKPIFDESNQHSPINIWLNQLDPTLKEVCVLALTAGTDAVVQEPPPDLTIHTVTGNASNIFS